MSFSSTPKCEHGNYIDAQRGLGCVRCELVTDEMVERAYQILADAMPLSLDPKAEIRAALEYALMKS